MKRLVRRSYEGAIEMTRSLQWRFLLIISLLISALIFVFPTLVKEIPSWWPKFFPQEKIHLGLDLQGGVHLTYEVETQKAVESRIEAIKNDLRGSLKKEQIFSTSLDRVQGDKIEAVLLNPEMKANFDAYLKDHYPNLKETTEKKEGDRVRVLLEMDPRQIEEIKKSAIDQALETIRNRVDQFGVAEPDISRQGEDMILVQLPGIKDPERAKELIGKTALLQFKLVDDSYDMGRALTGGAVPFGDVLLYQRTVDPKTGAVSKIPYLIQDKTLMTGDALKDAQVRLGQNNMPLVGISFHSGGAKDFEQITTENVGRRLAIILDNNVYSAPVIKQPISGGEAVIEGRFSLEEARDLAIVLRAGSLPAPVKVLEERTVGPSLGQDSINKGIKSVIIGSLLVALFMLIYYRLSGLVADIALGMNIVLLLGALAVLGARLTLPGIAGIALTVGMAVDANVLIYERIREEMRLGKPPGATLEAGYSRAFLTVVDTHVTTIVAALVLLQFGTGPIKGFAVTLAIGVAASMFTAFVVTRFIFDFVLHNMHVKRLSV
jgi:preprotein translocase subunit SecD